MSVTVTGEDLFWELAEALLTDPAVTRSTMMGLPCLRLDGRFFASLDRRTQALLVKLPADRVNALIASGHAEAFAPAGRVFREWAALARPDRRRWRKLLTEARHFAAGAPPGAPPASPNATTSPPEPPAYAPADIAFRSSSAS